MVRQNSRSRYKLGGDMLGASKAISSISAVSTYSVFVTPDPVNTTAPPGGSTSVLATANVTAFVGPLTAVWERISGDIDITVNSPTSLTTTFDASGPGRTLYRSVFRVTVTDTGNANLETSSTVSVMFTFQGA